MADADRCPECGSDLPPNAPKGHCPRCLLQQGLDGSTLSLARGGPAATMPLASGSQIGRILAMLAELTGPVPRLLLRDSDPGTDPGPVVKPSSPEMPEPSDPDARLQLLGEIARGGMGAVLKGRDGDIGRDLAVKVLLEKHRDDPELIRRFIEEAQIAGQLQHPGVVPVYELGAFGDRRPYFTMKLVKGRTLADILGSGAILPPIGRGILGHFLQVCQTVAYAHARGVIHRDLKPSNIMVGGFGEVQVMDWGLAKVLPRGGARDDAEAGQESAHETVIATARSGSDSDLSRAGSVMGTPAYMAPEQARGEIDRVDERADVFALGSILCEVLTGRPAFTGRSPGEIQRKAALGDLAGTFDRLETCGADADLLELARACLAAEREDRPRDAAAVAARLSSYLTGVQERLRVAELARAAESARAEEACRTAEEAERARSAEAARAEEAERARSAEAARAEEAERARSAEAARAEEALARAIVERSRRRRTMALAASLLTMMGLGGATFAYIARQRQARSDAVERRLGRASTLLDQARDQPEDPARWRTALAAVQQVEEDPAGIVPAARDRLARLRDEATSGQDAALSDEALRKALVDVRANTEDAGPARTDAAYARAFRDAGLDLQALGVAEAAERLKRRPAAVVTELAAYLDHWSQSGREAKRPPDSWRKPLDVARAADADDYRNQLRALLANDDRKATAAKLKALADEPRAAELPAPTAVLLAAALGAAGEGEAAIGLLRRAVGSHPDDVWVNFALAASLRRSPQARDEVLRYYTAARALRPETGHRLAHLHYLMGRSAESVAIFRDLIRRRPDISEHLTCFGTVLTDEGRGDEAGVILDRAVEVSRAALKREPDDFTADFALGHALELLGKPAEAEAAYRAALKFQPNSSLMHSSLGKVLKDQGKLAEAEAELREAVKLQPDYGPARVELGNLLQDRGSLAQAEAEYREALKVTPDDHLTHHRLGQSLAVQGKAAEAEAEFRAAVKFKPDHAQSHIGIGNALVSQGKLAEAAAEYREAVKLNPNDAEAHCNLGQVLRRTGHPAEAVEALRRGHELGSRRPGWSYPSAEWLREAEQIAALDSRLPAVLKGDDRPADASEGLALAQICYDRKLHAAAARLFAGALRADPALTRDRAAQHAYNAACAAALAGCGQGKDDPPPDEAARSRLRAQAFGWLKDELAAWSKILEGGQPQARAAIRQVLEHWKDDSDLAGVRDEAALAKLPEAERRAWRTLWSDVETLLKNARGDRH